MSKAVMISIHPRWCAKIASGEKTVEVRKTCPKLKTPFKCYIYETKAAVFSKDTFSKEYYHGFTGCGHVIGEFVCDKLVWVVSHPEIFAKRPMLHAKAIADACLTQDEAEAYSNGKDVYGWHISDLAIYDEPKELSDFCRPCPKDHWCGNCGWYFPGVQDYGRCEPPDCGFRESDESMITRPPQSWCYVDA